MAGMGTAKCSKVVGVVVVLLVAGGELPAADVKIYDDGQLAVWGREIVAGVTEPAVDTYCAGVRQGSFQALEAYDKVPGQPSWPLMLVGIPPNMFLRLTYQRLEGSSASLGTSVVGAMSYRTGTGLKLVPEVQRAEVLIGGSDRYRTVLDGRFGTDALVQSTYTFPDPPIGASSVGLTVGFQAQSAINLAPGTLGVDDLRLVTLESMFADALRYDANVIRWLDTGGVEHTLRLTDATPRDTRLFASPQEIDVGGFVELVKEEGSTWFPDSPSIRLDLDSRTGLSGRIGIQGWLAATTDPTDDSLTVWLEWIDAPPTIPSGATYEAAFMITATPPSIVPEPATCAMLAVGWLALAARRSAQRRCSEPRFLVHFG